MHTALATAASSESSGTDAPHRSLRDDGDPGQREQCADDRHGPQALLTLAHRQQQRRQRDQGQEGLAEPGMQPDQGVVGQGEGGAEVQGAVHQGTGQRPTMRKRQPPHGHDRQQQGGGQAEPETGTPQGGKLAVAEPDRDPIAASQHSAGQEAGQHHALPIAGHGPTICWAIAIPPSQAEPAWQWSREPIWVLTANTGST
jgi:hypothetical protein